MTSELASVVAANYPSPALLGEHGSTSDFGLDPVLQQPKIPPVFPYHRTSESGDAFHCSTPDDYVLPLTNDLTAIPGPWDLFMAEVTARRQQMLAIRQAYRDRIETLRSDAGLDGFLVNKASERDFWSFAQSVPFAQKADVVLVDNGNLRLIWDSEDGTHLGLQFLGHRTLQYVIFRRRQGNSNISRVAGRDTLEGVAQQIRAFGLGPLLQR